METEGEDWNFKGKRTKSLSDHGLGCLAVIVAHSRIGIFRALCLAVIVAHSRIGIFGALCLAVIVAHACVGVFRAFGYNISILEANCVGYSQV